MDYTLARQILLHSLWPMVIFACTMSNKEQLSEQDTIQSTQPEKQIRQVTPMQRSKHPLDTIVASYSDKNKLLVLAYEYYDSLPTRPIKYFEVLDAQTNQIVFSAASNRLALGDEVDHFTGDTDSIILIPTYHISRRDPLIVDLKFSIRGDRWISFIDDITCNVQYIPENQTEKYIDFLSYNFTYNNKWEFTTSVMRPMCKCQKSAEYLLSNFNKLEAEERLHTIEGEELIKQSFICYLNASNPNHKLIVSGFKNVTGLSIYPYYSLTYISYFGNFIINLQP